MVVDMINPASNAQHFLQMSGRRLPDKLQLSVPPKG